MITKRLTNRFISFLAARWPALSRQLVASFRPLESTSIPWHPVTKPLERSKLALVTTGGLHHPSQEHFNMYDTDGDPTYRVIHGATIEQGHTITHDYYDHRSADKDLNVVFPITRLKELQAAGCIGAIADRHFSFMGHIDGPHVQTLIKQTAAQVAGMLKAQQVDAVLLTPAWGICHQSVGLIQRVIEASGIATIGISINRPYTEKIKPPRSIFLRWPFGHPMGEPHKANQQAAVLGKALEALHSIQTPGQIMDVNWRWRRETYPEPPWYKNPKECIAA